MSKKIYLIDGSGFIFRAYHALPPLTRPDGTPIGAVLGFTNMLVRLLTEFGAHKMAVVFDSGRYNFRHDIYPDYKANRPEAPEDLVPQFPLVREACAAFDVPMVECPGYEADDVIATLVKHSTAEGYEVVIISSDKDLMQLVTSKVTLFDHMKDKYIGEKEVEEKFGVMPAFVGDVLALAGDSSDNVPGVPGIGPKTAAELLNRFGSFEAIFKNLSEISQPKRRATLEAHQEQALLSRKLVALEENVDLPITLNALDVGEVNGQKRTAFLKEQGFKGLLSRMTPGEGPKGDEKSASEQPLLRGTYHLIQDIEALNTLMKRIQQQGYVAIDTETTSLDAMQAELVGISLALTPGEAFYVPCGHVVQPELGMSPDALRQLTRQEVLETLEAVLQDPAILKIGHNLKYDLLVLRKYQTRIAPIDDTMLLSYMVAPGPHGLDALAKEYFGHEMIAFKEVVGVGKKAKNFADVGLEEACQYAAEDADFTLRLWLKLKPEVQTQGVLRVYERIDKPLIPVLIEMEANGIQVDGALLRQLSQVFEQELKSLEADIHRLAGTAFNIASPKQLGDILFETLGLPGGKKSKTGAYGTNVDVLEKLAHEEGAEIAAKVLEWRQFAKLKSTYTDSLLSQINPNTHRVHTSYAMAVTNTGRLSSSDPNLQNIPVRTEMGRRIREAFVAKPGHSLISLDYSQIELRLLASMANISALKEAFASGVDVHQLTASQVFGVALEEVDAFLRRKAKAINFGIIYGISAFGLARQLGVSNGEAAAYIKAYNKQYPGILAFMDETKEQARQQGYVETLFGRRCYVPMINARNPMQRAFAERQAINAPLQGSAADIIKLAMKQVPTALEAGGFSAKLLLQVHDELILEAPDQEVSTVSQVVREIMQQAVTLDVPLLVDIGSGPNWEAAH